MNIQMLKAAFAGLVLSLSGFVNAGLVTIDFNGGAAGASVGSDYSSNGVTFEDTFYSTCFGSGWVSGENDTCYNSNKENDIIGHFSGTTDFISAVLQYPDWNVTSLLQVFDVNDNLLSSTSVTNTNTSISLAHAGIASFRFTWLSADDVVGLQEISFNEVASVNVTEPSTFAIFIIGIMGLSARRFKKC